MGHIRNLQIRRRCRWVRGLAYTVFCIVVIVGGAMLIGGCATMTSYENMRERAQRAEAELEKQTGFTQGAQDDAAQLMRVIIEQQGYIRELESGAVMQAEYIARIRQNCEL